MAEVNAVNAGMLMPSIMGSTFPIEESTSNPRAAPPVPLSIEDYRFVEARHPSTVLQGLNSMRLNNAFCDVTLCCGGQEFPCHRIVLASFSSYFQVNLSKLSHKEWKADVYKLEIQGNHFQLCLLLGNVFH